MIETPSNNHHLILPPKELLARAEKKIAEMETQAINGVKEIEKLKWQNAQLRVAVTALGRHFNCEPDAAKIIIDAYMKEQEDEFQKQTEEAKAQYISDLKAGRVPQFPTIDQTKEGQ